MVKKKNVKFKKLISLMIFMVMMFTTTVSAFAENKMAKNTNVPSGYVTVSMEKFTLGLGYIIEPVKVPIYEETTVAKVITDLLGKGNYTNTGSIENGFYLASVKDNDTREAVVPKYIVDEVEKAGEMIDTRAEEGWLGEFDYTFMSGWMYSVNNWFPNYGSSDYILKDGDVVRWQFTVFGYGMDIGGGFAGDATEGSFQGSYIPMANKDALTAKLAEVNSADNKGELLAKEGVQAAYDKSYEVIQVAEASQESIDVALTTLNSTLNPEVTPPVPDIDLVQPSPSVNEAISQTAADMYKNTPDPKIGTFAGEWTILSLARAGYDVPQSYYDKYYSNVENELIEKGGVLHKVKYTEYSRVILGLTSIGRDVTNVGGYNLLEKLADFNAVKKQGINGPIFALIALDTNKYEIPIVDGVKVQTTRDMLIDYILGLEITAADGTVGGWALSGKVPDPDITAMALQSLAPYKEDPKVKPYIDRAIQVLADIQLPSGGYASWGTTNSESIAQVIVALTALGIDPATDTRFIKEGGNWIVSAIMDFYVQGGGFKHILDGEKDAMATDQGMYALVAYNRFVNGKNSLYDMTDVHVTENLAGKAVITAPERITGNRGTEFKINIKVGSWPEGTFKLLDGIITLPNGVEVKEVNMSSSISGGLPDFGVEDNKLRLVYTNTDLNDITFTSENYPADVMTVTLALTEDLAKDSELVFSLDNLNLKAGSDAAATSPYDTGKGSARVIIGEAVTAKGRILYDGDGIDLIPADKSAVAVEFSNLTGAPTITFNEKNTMVYSKAMSDKSNVPTYVALVNKTEALDGLNDMTKYSINNKDSLTIKFGDSNGDEVINAQDALNTLSAWLRKSNAPTDNKILAMNVTADSRIDTYDVLGVMEHYVNGNEFRVISK
ncbi:MAG: DUF4430 domain-containing protein [Clostridium sp.]|nr:DUF4430 domain-containing protein [Clostridium sp.]MDU7082307.1 DUF4430 domain-containing protein [Clostridium sp.]